MPLKWRAWGMLNCLSALSSADSSCSDISVSTRGCGVFDKLVQWCGENHVTIYFGSISDTQRLTIFTQQMGGKGSFYSINTSSKSTDLQTRRKRGRAGLLDRKGGSLWEGEFERASVRWGAVGGSWLGSFRGGGEGRGRERLWEREKKVFF